MAMKWLARGSGLFALAVFAYLPATWSGSIWDDDSYLLDNANLNDLAGLGRIWLQSRSSPQYYPVVFSSFWLEKQAWGLSLAGFHWVNVLLHAANAVLVWRGLKTLKLPGAWFAAALFALHPVHVESVAWITERKNVLSTFFYLISLSAYWRFSAPDARREVEPVESKTTAMWLWYVISSAAFVLALGSKTVTCSLPATILLIVWWKRGTVSRRDILALLPYFVVGVFASSRTSWLEKYHVGALGPDWDFSFAERAIIAGRALWFYAGKLIAPVNLMFIYPRWRIEADDWRQYLPVLGVLVIPAILWSWRMTWGRGPLVAFLFFVGTLFPALGFFNVFPMLYSFVADHFQYLASLGVLVPLAVGVEWFFSRKMHRGNKTVRWAQACVLFILAILAISRETAFANKWTLWADTLSKNPDCWMAQNNLGLLYMQSRKLDEAMPHFDEALRLNPKCLDARYNRGATLEEQGRLSEASRDLAQVLSEDPKYWKAHFVMGLVLKKQGRFDEAAESFRSSLRLNPTYQTAQAELRGALARAGTSSSRGPG